MRKLILVAQVSLDGYVSDAKGSFDHFLGGEENLEFVCGITDHADAALLGRKSYELLDSGWPSAAQKPGATANEIRYSNWYNNVPKYIVSSAVTKAGSANSIFINGDICGSVQNIKATQGKDILLFGSPSLAQLMIEQKLLDGCWIILHPVLFGDGIPLFGRTQPSAPFRLIETRQLSTGVLCLRYDID